MTATTTAPPVQLDEAEAAALEGIAPMPLDLIALREKKLRLSEERDALNAQIDEIKATFAERLEAYGVQGFELNGKVHARKSLVRTPRLDTKKFKAAHPKIWAAFTVVTTSVRVTIN